MAPTAAHPLRHHRHSSGDPLRGARQDDGTLPHIKPGRGLLPGDLRGDLGDGALPPPDQKCRRRGDDPGHRRG